MAVVTQVTKPAHDISLDFTSPQENDVRVYMYVYPCERLRCVTRKRVRERAQLGIIGHRRLFVRVEREREREGEGRGVRERERERTNGFKVRACVLIR